MTKESKKELSKHSNFLLSSLGTGDAEFLLKRAASGKLRIRVGQIWRIPERKGRTALYLDLDGTKEKPVKNCDRTTIRKRLSKCGVVTDRILVRTSPSGYGLHVVVWVVGRFPRMDRVALQAILESDPEREAQNFRRAKQASKDWGPDWQVLFERRS